MDDKDRNSIFTTSPWYPESLIDTLSSEEQALFTKAGIRCHYEPGSTIVQVNEYVDRIIYVAEGLIRSIVFSSDGTEKTVYYTDRFVALECFFHSQPCGYSAIAYNDVVAYEITRSDAEMLLDNRAICMMFLKVLSSKCRVLGWQVNNLTLASPLGKVCRMLCCYFTSEESGRIINLTHQEIASITGLHRVTVTKTINLIKDMNIIYVDKHGHISIRDWNKLKEIGFDGYL